MKSNNTSENPTGKTSPGPFCLLQSVSGALREEPTLEAVTIDRGQQKISVATLGKADEEALRSRVSDSVERVKTASGDHRCALLEGEPNCDGCDVALPDS